MALGNSVDPTTTTTGWSGSVVVPVVVPVAVPVAVCARVWRVESSVHKIMRNSAALHSTGSGTITAGFFPRYFGIPLRSIPKHLETKEVIGMWGGCRFVCVGGVDWCWQVIVYTQGSPVV